MFANVCITFVKWLNISKIIIFIKADYVMIYALICVCIVKVVILVIFIFKKVNYKIRLVNLHLWILVFTFVSPM